MLQTSTTTKTGKLGLVGFTPPDLAHLTANQPIQLDAARLGLPDRPVIVLYETDPMFRTQAPRTRPMLARVSQRTSAGARRIAAALIADAMLVRAGGDAAELREIANAAAAHLVRRPRLPRLAAACALAIAGPARIPPTVIATLTAHTASSAEAPFAFGGSYAVAAQACLDWRADRDRRT